MRKLKKVTLVTIVFGFTLLFISTAQAQFVVTKTADTADGTCDADCSLREAIIAANAAAGANTITFDSTVFATGGAVEVITLTITGTTAATGDLDITDSLTITGTGARELIINGNGTDRVFDITAGITVTITDLSVTNGTVTNTTEGGGIRNLGTLTLNRVSVRDNVLSNTVTAGVDGGGISNSGTLTITDSTISNNRISANGDGGGIRNNTGASLTITNSTISDNQAGTGNGDGGGIENSGTVSLTNVTISNNSAGAAGGGINNTGTGTVTLRNTIVANNTGGSNPDVSGTFTTSGGNLIGNNTGATASFPAGNPNANGDRVGTAAMPLNPMLGGLANNGGQTDTRALLPGSPAINGSNDTSSPLAFDQRGAGFPRQIGPRVDIGAFEALGPTAATVNVSGQVLTTDGHPVWGAVVSFIDAAGTRRSVITDELGFYLFDDVTAGETYVFDVKRKGYVFPTQVVFVIAEENGLNFISPAPVKIRRRLF